MVFWKNRYHYLHGRNEEENKIKLRGHAIHVVEKCFKVRRNLEAPLHTWWRGYREGKGKEYLIPTQMDRHILRSQHTKIDYQGEVPDKRHFMAGRKLTLQNNLNKSDPNVVKEKRANIKQE